MRSCPPPSPGARLPLPLLAMLLLCLHSPMLPPQSTSGASPVTRHPPPSAAVFAALPSPPSPMLRPPPPPASPPIHIRSQPSHPAPEPNGLVASSCKPIESSRQTGRQQQDTMGFWTMGKRGQPLATGAVGLGSPRHAPHSQAAHIKPSQQGRLAPARHSNLLHGKCFTGQCADTVRVAGFP